jgi:hypothetical protein
MEAPLTTDGRGIQHGLYAKSERAVKARNQGVRRIMNHMLAIAPWLADSDRAALRAWCELEWLTRRVKLVLTQPDLDRDATLKWSSARLEHLPHMQGVPGSSPGASTKDSRNQFKAFSEIINTS